MLSPVAKKATRRLIRCCSDGLMRERRSVTSVEKSTSSTVHVFLIAVLNISKKTGYFIGRSVRLTPGSRIMMVPLLARFAEFRIFQGTGNGLDRRFFGHGNSCFRDFRRRARTQVVGRFEPLFPCVHVHRRQLSDGRALEEQIQ